jgi:transposase
VVGQGKHKLQEFLVQLMDGRQREGLSPRMILLVADARAQWAELDRRIAAFDAEFVAAAKASDDVRRLTTVLGFGALTATAAREAPIAAPSLSATGSM